MIKNKNLRPGTRIKIKSLDEIKSLNDNFIGLDDSIINFLTFCADRILTVQSTDNDEIFVKENKNSCLIVNEIKSICRNKINIKIKDEFFRI